MLGRLRVSDAVSRALTWLWMPPALPGINLQIAGLGEGAGDPLPRDWSDGTLKGLRRGFIYFRAMVPYQLEWKYFSILTSSIVILVCTHLIPDLFLVEPDEFMMASLNGSCKTPGSIISF